MLEDVLVQGGIFSVISAATNILSAINEHEE
jgi:hypothetical protein